MAPSVRAVSDADRLGCVPVHVVWEITLACDQKCRHCGSRAGRTRAGELSTAECVEVIDALARLGTREITLIGGEVYLRRDWTELVREIRARDIRCTAQTGARNLGPERLAAAVAAGLQGVGVSIDGLAPLHDELRGVPGSHARAIDALRRIKAAGIDASVNTQIGARTLADLPALMDEIVDAGATHWQTQLTVAMGNAVDHDEILLQPHALREVMPALARLFHRGMQRGLLLAVGNNIGYFGPYEHLWRGLGDERTHWSGCGAGRLTMGIEADGTIKGCPSLATVGFAGGNVRDAGLAELWARSPELHFGRLRDRDDLWGFCRGCYYADVCRGGCTWTAHSLFGRAGNNPYCHHRVLTLAGQGLRERVVKRKEAPDRSFAIGEFALVLEPLDGGPPVEVREPAPTPLIPPGRLRRPAPEVSPARLEPCGSCREYVYASESVCPHCGVGLAAAAQAHDADVRRRRGVIDELRRALERARRPT